jgi:hypothetical protein
MIQEAGLQALTATALVRPQANLSGFCGGQWHGGISSLDSYAFPLSLSFQRSSIIISNFKATLKEGQTGEAWDPSNKTGAFSDIGVRHERLIR